MRRSSSASEFRPAPGPGCCGDIISILSRSMELKPGDLVMTGTPAGVGTIVAGDKVTGGIDGLGEIGIAVGEPIAQRSQRVVRNGPESE